MNTSKNSLCVTSDGSVEFYERDGQVYRAPDEFYDYAGWIQGRALGIIGCPLRSFSTSDCVVKTGSDKGETLENDNMFDHFAAYIDEPSDGSLHVAARKQAQEDAQAMAKAKHEQKVRDTVVARLAQRKPEDAEELIRYADTGEISEKYLSAARRELEGTIAGKIDGISKDNLLASAQMALDAAKKKDFDSVTFDLMYPFQDHMETSHEYILSVAERLINLDFALWYVAALGAPTIAALFLGTALKPFTGVCVESYST